MRNIPDCTCGGVKFRDNLDTVLDDLRNVEHSKRHGDRYPDRCIREVEAWVTKSNRCQEISSVSHDSCGICVPGQMLRSTVSI